MGHHQNLENIWDGMVNVGYLKVQEGVSQEMEVARAVGQMKSGKAGGLTQLVSEIIPAAGQAVMNKIMKICDLVMDEGMVPEDWELSIYKEKGDPLECGPYWLEHAIWIYAWKGMIDAIFMVWQLQEGFLVTKNPIVLGISGPGESI